MQFTPKQLESIRKEREQRLSKRIGKCPKCGAVLTGNDITHTKLETRISVKYSYPEILVCNKCGYIIGFGTTFDIEKMFHELIKRI